MCVVKESLGGSLVLHGLPSHDQETDLEKFPTAILTTTQ